MMGRVLHFVGLCCLIFQSWQIFLFINLQRLSAEEFVWQLLIIAVSFCKQYFLEENCLGTMTKISYFYKYGCSLVEAIEYVLA